MPFFNLYRHYKLVFFACQQNRQNKNARFFYNNAPYEIRQRLYLYGNSKQKEESISNFKNSKNGILIGPTLIDGIDLPNDYCRFIIIMKIPYPNITNKIVKKKIE